ncbi:MAG TPA: cytochrome P450 [Streptosporangiaceae bacterium]|nr:cytochrome P450 [Streptosporangiaceae bacterium]HVB45670.1 cytochrome P450 [Streptosporangiaceae bacterium]
MTSASAAAAVPDPPPGPRLPRLLQTVLILGRPVSYLEECRRRYGPVFQVRIIGRPPIVYVTSAELAAQVYATDQHAAVRGAVREFFAPVVGASSLICLDGEHWTRHRKRLNPLLRPRVVAAFRADIAAIAAAEIDRWPLGQPFALRPRMEAILLDVSLRAIFGVQDEVRRAALRSLLSRLIAASTAMMATPPSAHRLIVRSRLAQRLTVLPTSRAIALRRQVDEFLAGEIAARRESPGSHGRDVLSQLLCDDAGAVLTDQEILDELMALLGAGHHTTATALAWAFEQLVRHPEAMARLREDIARGSDRYLDAVVWETLRVRPVVPTATRRLTRPLALGRYAVPAGWLVTPAIPLLHGDPAIWPRSRMFQPERFLGEGMTGPAVPEWMPFGGGLRMCIGAHLATLEIKVVLREALTRVNLASASQVTECSLNRYSMLVPSRRAQVIATELLV